MRSSLLRSIPDHRTHSPSRPAITATASKCKLSYYVTRSTACSSRCSSVTSIRQTSNKNFRNELASTDSSGRRSRDVSLQAAKKEPNSPDSEQLLKAGLDIAKTVAAADPRVQALSALAGKYIGSDILGSSAQQPGAAYSASTQTAPYQRVALLAILLVNVATFVLANDIAPQFFASLPLNHLKTGWWQFVSSAFCSTSWQQLSAVTFMVAAFGSQLVARHGTAAAWGAYTLGAAGTNLFWYWLLPEKIGRAALLTTSSLYGAFALFLAASFLQGSFTLGPEHLVWPLPTGS